MGMPPQASAAAAWLAARPLIGVIGPALPPFPRLHGPAGRRPLAAGGPRLWRVAAKEYGVPLSSEAPPLPAGCAVLRGGCLPRGGCRRMKRLPKPGALPLVCPGRRLCHRLGR